MTEGQIDRAVELFRAQLRKHAAELPSETVQQVFGQSELTREWFEVLRRRVETTGSLIIRWVKVDRTRTPRQVLDATGREQYTDREVVDSMPWGQGKEVEVVFFKLDRHVSDTDLKKEYTLLGLVPADPFSVAAVKVADPTFADTYPNGTHWQDAHGRWYFAAFRCWHDGERLVNVNRNGSGWPDGWWFAGLRK